jgi:site-specific recombinase XerD
VDLTAALTEYSFACDADNIGCRTWGWCRQKLTAFFVWRHEQDITTVEGVSTPLVRRYLVSLQDTTIRYGQPLSGYTIHGYAQVIKGFLTWCADEDLLDAKIVRKISMPKVEQKILATYTEEQVAALFAVCQQAREGWIGTRDTAILNVLLDTGIRASELCDLTLDRVYFEGEDPHLRINGKGRKQREVGLGRKSRQALHRYLYRLRQAVPTEPHVFVSFKETLFTPKGLDDLLYRLRDRAGITGVRCSAHTFRHTYAVTYLKQGGDIYRLSRLLGHTSVTVTENHLKAFRAKDARNGQSVLDRLGR